MEGLRLNGAHRLPVCVDDGAERHIYMSRCGGL